MCSAPGGKALAIAMNFDLESSNSRLVCSDVSSTRRAQLKRVIVNYPPPKVRQRVSVITGDGTTSAFIREFGEHFFDRVLVDAPCSSERHVLQNEREMIRWNGKRSKVNAKRQVSLLLNAIRLTKSGGQ